MCTKRVGIDSDRNRSSENCEYIYQKNPKITKFLLIGLEMIGLELIGLELIGLKLIGLKLIGLEMIGL